MTRPMSTAMQNALNAQVIRPVLIAFMDIASDPITMWTGPGAFAPTGSGDSVLDGKTFLSAESVADVSDIQEDQGIGGPVTILLKANDLDADALRQFVKDRRAWRGRPAYLWMGLFDSTAVAVISSPIRIKTGIMTRVSVVRSTEDVFIELVIDSDLQNARSAKFEWIDHQRVYPDDRFSSFILELANKPAGLERSRAVEPAYWDREFDSDGFRNQM
jgi:hypothetical protein